MSRILLLLTAISLFSGLRTEAQLLTPEKATYTRADSLRGSITPERAWWNLLKYDLQRDPVFYR